MRTKIFKATTLAVSLAFLGLGSTAVLAGADDESVINDDMSRLGPGTTSGSGDTVEANCALDPSGNAWQGATATLKIEQVGNQSVARIKVKNAVPNEVFTVWLRVKGDNLDENDVKIGSFGGSPLTDGGATPLAPGSALDAMNHYSPWIDDAGTSFPTNGFTTDKNGAANWSIALDFPVVGGAYPFNLASDAVLATTPTGGPGTPTAIVDPRQPRVGGPFLIRVISHCTDHKGHGLSPDTREAWFQYP